MRFFAASAATLLFLSGAATPASAEVGERTDVFVVMREKADLSAVRGQSARTTEAYRRLTGTAASSQRALRRLLSDSKAEFTPFWLVNTILVKNADPALVRRLKSRSDVERVRTAGSTRHIEPVEVLPTEVDPVAAAADWNVTEIGAPQVWSGFADRGSGIVVASIDTGVDYTHPDLKTKYRGYSASGYSHDYNWFDPAQVCANQAPCDNNGHGTHTMGTIVGGGDTFGVAPAATWIAAKGCESNSCSEESLLAAGQWVVAPTDRSGDNPRPDLAPDVVSNSWGGGSNDPFYTAIVDAWRAAGIFPVFAAGNEGPQCGTAHSPGDYTTTYAVGAYGEDGAIAGYSSRGLAGGETKPNISAPGTNVRSAYPGGGYAYLSGTSMATPHVTGAIALIWSAAPSLAGDIAGTAALLDETARSVTDLDCGGTGVDNNVWGRGKLDAYSAVTFAPRGTTGTLNVQLTDANTGAALSGVAVTLTAGTARRAVTTDATGGLSLRLAPGTYHLDITPFGYPAWTGDATVTSGATTAVTRALTASPRVTVTGRIVSVGGQPVTGSVVTFVDTPLPTVTTGNDGRYTVAGVPLGTFTLATSAANCSANTQQKVTVTSATLADLIPPDRYDKFGHHCQARAATWVDTTTALTLTGDDAAQKVTLPFTLSYYGQSYSSMWVTTNGNLNFQRSNWLALNEHIPSNGYPNAAVYPLWADLLVDSQASVRTASLGQAPNRRFVVEWRNVAFYGGAGRATFEVILDENGEVTIQYGAISDNALARGSEATVGFENAAGTDAVEYSYNSESIRSGLAVWLGGLSVFSGHVTTPDGTPLPGATVQLVTYSLSLVGYTYTDTTGYYQMLVPSGEFIGVAGVVGYTTEQIWPIVVEPDAVTTLNWVLRDDDNKVTGTVRDSTGAPLAGVSVRLTSVYVDDVDVTTGADGKYTFTGVHIDDTHTLLVVNACVKATQTPVVIDGDVTVDMVRDRYRDTAGNTCSTPSVTYRPGTTPVTLSDGTNGYAAVALPFAFPYYGQTYQSVNVSKWGLLTFTRLCGSDCTTTSSTPAPTPERPDGAIYAYWSSLTYETGSAVRTATVTEGAATGFVIEYAGVTASLNKLSFSVTLWSDGRIQWQYTDFTTVSLPIGVLAGVGLENSDSTTGMAFSWRSDLVLHPGLTIQVTPPGVTA